MSLLKTFPVTFLTAEKFFAEGMLVIALKLPGEEGDIEVFSKHTPLILALRPGVVVFRRETGSSCYFIGGGVADILPDHVTLLATEVIPVEKLDPETLSQQIQTLEQALMTEKNLEMHAHLSKQLQIAHLKRACV